MDGRQEVRDLLDRLPDDVSVEDVLYHLYVYWRIQEGLASAESSEGIPHEEVVEEFRQKFLRAPGERAIASRVR